MRQMFCPRSVSYAGTKYNNRARSAHKTTLPLSATESRRLGRGLPPNMFEHVTAQQVVRVYEEA